MKKVTRETAVEYPERHSAGTFSMGLMALCYSPGNIRPEFLENVAGPVSQKRPSNIAHRYAHAARSRGGIGVWKYGGGSAPEHSGCVEFFPTSVAACDENTGKSIGNAARDRPFALSEVTRILTEQGRVEENSKHIS